MRIRLLADDRTGAIDTAVRFVPLAGPLLVQWDLATARSSDGSLAFDLGTRELSDARSGELAASAAGLLRDADLAYLKCDSLLRGSLVQEIVACLRAQPFDHCVIAPAFPAQRRITRDGRQWAAAHGSDQWQLAGPDLAAQLGELGFAVSKCRAGDRAPQGISLWDAETIEALQQIVVEGRRLSGRMLWCGSAGLAEAMAGAEPLHIGTIASPLLALVGTDHPVTLRQLREAEPHRVMFDPEHADGIAPIEAQLEKGVAVVTVRLPATPDRHQAANHIGEGFTNLLARLPQPGTLFVTGGETLSHVCAALGAEALEVQGEIEPGIPVSVLKGGKWQGVRVISKSGAFGNEGLIRRLISLAQL
ncbi:nucleotide-binding domain containing protein [Bradyrhizobium sp. dw_411]|uniref:nucleotide-binding domain containing protein n=1 Tax=Bradyrhizobium sp. dw_411 TaxID=2720082 RepID=UPI001BD0300E|nr:nucleotide-binding domain containing protein [Bradyrhizobium sp. dw_411]